MSATITSFGANGTAALFRRRWGWLLAFAIVQILAGAFAIAVPTVASLVAVAIFGWLMILSAIFQIVHAIRVRQWKGFALHFIGGLLYAASGVLALIYPFSGLLALTLLLAGLFLAEGILRVALASSIRPQEGWGWILAGGVASIMLGGMLILGFPSTALWAIGLLFGVNLLFGGATNAALALTCRKKEKEDARDEHGPATAPA